MKAISTVLAIVLIVIIVVALVGLTYSFSVALFGVTTGAGERMTERTVTGLMSQVRIESMSINDVIIRNIGSRDITELTVLINGEQSNYTLDPPVIEPDKLGTIKIMDFIKEDYEIGIIPGEGNVVNIKASDPCDHAVLCLNMDEGYGGTASDSSGFSGNDGTINGAIWVDGKFGKALSFDGIDDYVNIPNSESLNITGNEITIEAWIYLTELKSMNPIIRKGSPLQYDVDSDGDIDTLDVNEDGIIDELDLGLVYAHLGDSISSPYPRYDVNRDGVVSTYPSDLAPINAHTGETNSVWSLIQTEEPENVYGTWFIFYRFIFSVGNGIRIASSRLFNSGDLNKWYHIAGTYNGSNISLYINSVLDNSASIIGDISPVNEELRMGNDLYIDYYNGIIDEVRIYNKVIY